MQVYFLQSPQTNYFWSQLAGGSGQCYFSYESRRALQPSACLPLVTRLAERLKIGLVVGPAAAQRLDVVHLQAP